MKILRNFSIFTENTQQNSSTYQNMLDSQINFPEIYSIQKINSENNFYAIKRENVEPFNEEKLSEVKDVFSVF